MKNSALVSQHHNSPLCINAGVEAIFKLIHWAEIIYDPHQVFICVADEETDTAFLQKEAPFTK